MWELVSIEEKEIYITVAAHQTALWYPPVAEGDSRLIELEKQPILAKET